MVYNTIISAADAAAHLHAADWLFVDCRSVLGRPGEGHARYLERHIPGAVFADLECDLSGRLVAGTTGRHPLPERPALEATLSRLGVSAGVQVVAYDESSGALAASRLWWLLRWAGHEAVAVLDGGLNGWLAAGLPTAAGEERRAAAAFTGGFDDALIADRTMVEDASRSRARVLLDSRAADRYRGENETIDPIAGHIPRAQSLPFAGNLGADGGFLRADALRRRFREALNDVPPEETIFYCGSGVTAAQNVLAYAHAGLGMPRLYPGSWSEWITDPRHEVEKGDPVP
jgi:thiosulfate/3-mercaptopyruvate sulfurtransferase